MAMTQASGNGRRSQPSSSPAPGAREPAATTRPVTTNAVQAAPVHAEMTHCLPDARARPAVGADAHHDSEPFPSGDVLIR
jgi:hypothetical protein